MSNHKSVKLSKYYGRLAGSDTQIIFLSKEEEVELFKLIERDGDQSARDRVIEAHLPLVFKIAQGYKGYNSSISDMIQNGTLGLLTAVDKFDLYKGFRFSTYASWWIRAEITENVAKNSNIVKYVTTTEKKALFFKLSKLEEKFYQENPDMTSEEMRERISQALTVSLDHVEEVQQLKGGAPSLNAPVKGVGDENGQVQDFILADEMNPEEITCLMDENSYQRDILKKAIQGAGLSERDKAIFRARRLVDDPLTLESLSQKFNVSRERIRQLEVRAFEKIQIAALGLISNDETPIQEKRQDRVLVNG